jgi:uncharacterized coiled-coil DUF342 family protein
MQHSALVEEQRQLVANLEGMSRAIAAEQQRAEVQWQERLQVELKNHHEEIHYLTARKQQLQAQLAGEAQMLEVLRAERHEMHKMLAEQARMLDVLRAERQELLAKQDQLRKELEELISRSRAYSESVMRKPAAKSFRRGWQESRRGETFPVERLWEGSDGE